MFNIVMIVSFIACSTVETIGSLKLKSELTDIGEAQFFANHPGLWSSKAIITHRTPLVVVAYLHTPFSWVATSNQSDLTIGANTYV